MAHHNVFDSIFLFFLLYSMSNSIICILICGFSHRLVQGGKKFNQTFFWLNRIFVTSFIFRITTALMKVFMTNPHENNEMVFWYTIFSAFIHLLWNVFQLSKVDGNSFRYMILLLAFFSNIFCFRWKNVEILVGLR